MTCSEYINLNSLEPFTREHGAKLNMALAIRNLDFDYFREVLFKANLLSFYDMHYNQGSNQEIRAFYTGRGPAGRNVRLWFEPISAMHFSSTLFCHCWMSGIQLMKKSTTLLENYFLNFIRWIKYFTTGLGTFFLVFLNSKAIHLKNFVSFSNMELKSTQKIIRGTICSTVQQKSHFRDVPDQ